MKLFHNFSRLGLLAHLGLASAVETAPIPVLRVIDGDTIEVAADLGGVLHPVRVRLLYVDTVKNDDDGKAMPEAALAAEHLRLLLIGNNIPVALWGPGESFESDAHGSILAIAYYESARVPVEEFGRPSAQQFLIGMGHSVYWQKHGSASGMLGRQLAGAQKVAKQDRQGLWATAPEWMQDKANDRTAPAK